MNRGVLADSGPLYALADRFDQYHSRAKRELKRLTAAGQVVLVSYPILAESHTLVLRRLGVAYGRQWLTQMIRGAQLVNPTALDYQDAALAVDAFHDQSITLFDATTATLSLRLDVPVWTYDHHFDVMRVPVWH